MSVVKPASFADSDLDVGEVRILPPEHVGPEVEPEEDLAESMIGSASEDDEVRLLPPVDDLGTDEEVHAAEEVDESGELESPAPGVAEMDESPAEDDSSLDVEDRDDEHVGSRRELTCFGARDEAGQENNPADRPVAIHAIFRWRPRVAESRRSGMLSAGIIAARSEGL